MSQNIRLLPKPRYIAPSIHVLATRLAQNTADRLTIGNTPLHILHLCDAQFLAPLFPSCSSLRAITVHLKYIASAAALEVFLKGAAACPSLRDVTLIGGATVMEAAAMAAGLAAFTSLPAETPAAPVGGDSQLGRPPRRVTRRGWEESACPRSPCTSALKRSPAVPVPPTQPCQASRGRLPLRGGHAASASASAFSCPPSPAEFDSGYRACPRSPHGHWITSLRCANTQGRRESPLSTHASSGTKFVTFSPAAPRSSGGVHLTWELHRVTEETSAVLLEGLRRGSRIASVALHLRVSTAEARLVGTRLAQRMKQVTLQHRPRRQRQQQTTLHCEYSPPLHLPLSGSCTGRRFPGAVATASAQTPRIASGVPSPFFRAPPHGGPGAGISGRYARHAPTLSKVAPATRGSPAHYSVWMPAVAAGHQRMQSLQSPHTPPDLAVAPHTPPFAHVLNAPASCPAVRAEPLQEKGGKACDVDVYRRQGRHFFSSERRGGVAALAAAATPRSPFITPQPPRLRGGKWRCCAEAVRQVRTPVASAHAVSVKSEGAHANPRQRLPSQPVGHGASARCSSSRRSASSTSGSSSFSPIVMEPSVLHGGRSSSFSSWSSRSTSPQPRPPPPPPPSHAFSVATVTPPYAPLIRRELYYRSRRTKTAGEQHTCQALPQRGQTAEHLHTPPSPPRQRSPHAPPSSALCSPRYCLRRGLDDLRRADGRMRCQAEITGAPHTPSRASRPTSRSSRERRSSCSCFVCVSPTRKADDAHLELASAAAAAAAAHTRFPLSPRTPTVTRTFVRGEAMLSTAAVCSRQLQHASLQPPVLPPSMKLCVGGAPPRGAAPSHSRAPFRWPLHRDCCASCENAEEKGTCAAKALSASRPTELPPPSAKAGSEASDGVNSANTSTPGITARTPEKENRKKRPYARVGTALECEINGGEQRPDSGNRHCAAEAKAYRGGSQGAASSSDTASTSGAASILAEQKKKRRCVSSTQLPSPLPDSVPSFLREATTSSDGTAATSTTTNAEEQTDSLEDSSGYVVYPYSLRFLRARVAEINQHVVWHQVKAAKAAEEHARRLAALEVTFAGRVTEQLSDILMVLTDMEHGSRSNRPPCSYAPVLQT